MAIYKINLERVSGVKQTFFWPLFQTEGNFNGYEPVSRTDNLNVVNGGAMIASPNFKGLNFGAPLFCADGSSGTALDNVNHIYSYGFERLYADQLISGDKFTLSNGSYITFDGYQVNPGEGFTVRFSYYNSAGTRCYPQISLSSSVFFYNTSMLFLPFAADPANGNYNLLPLSIVRVYISSPYLRFDASSAVGPISAELGRSFWEGYAPVDLDDPYQNVEDSEPSGPAEGVGIPSSDPVDFPSLPSFSITDTGFVTLFNPTLGQVKALSDYMWNGLFDLNNFKKIMADPMDCILGFNMLPVNVPHGDARDVCIGNILSTVAMNVATSQWVEVDCGQLDLGLPYGSYLDFSPYTKYSIYLPYIGTCDLSADDVAGKVLQLKYHVDVLSCSCVAYLKCGDSVLYQWTGSCGYSIPVTQNDFSRMIMALMSIVGAGIGGAITAGGGAAGALIGAAKGAGESAAKNVMGLKPDVHRSGSIGSSAGLMGGQTPYLILEVPKACKPAKQYHYLGYPSFTTVKLGDVTGRQDFDSVILDGIPCTEEERDMIAAACAGGIYL